MKEKLLQGYKAGRDGKTKYKVHLDGYNMLPRMNGEADEHPRKEFFYFSDDGDLALGKRPDMLGGYFSGCLLHNDPFVADTKNPLRPNHFAESRSGGVQVLK